nr:RNA-directed DNA polymerase, eukaryota, reverse transcriptase zinc-binding domain protein [Tanacetum cinerariifolium]
MAKDSGGLVPSLYALNRGLMMKWVWRFYNQKTSLWANVIKAIHGEDESMGQGGAEQEQLDALMDLVSTVNLMSMGDRQIARKISLWWNVNYEDVNSYDEWSTCMVNRGQWRSMVVKLAENLLILPE